jgi:hypothetical protein
MPADGENITVIEVDTSMVPPFPAAAEGTYIVTCCPSTTGLLSRVPVKFPP